MVKTAVAIRHVGFEDLGSFESVLRRRGYQVNYYDVGIHELWTLEAHKVSLLIILGGPISANETDKYPFLAEELDIIGNRLSEQRPILGICLGAQLMARALGAAVYAGEQKEIGFGEISLTAEGRASCLAPLAEGDTRVLHWHGETFELPEGAVRLAETSLYANQAFALGSHALGLQFHPEAALKGFERWLIGHTGELGATGIDVCGLRRDAERYAPDLERKAGRVLERWLDQLDEPAR